MPGHHLLTLFARRGGGALYRLRDLFTTAAVAPLASPRTAEPGPGTLTLIDPADQLSISGAALQVAGGDGAGWVRGFYGTTGLARMAGRSLVVSFTQVSGSAYAPLVWSRSAGIVAPNSAGTSDHALRQNAGNPQIYINGTAGPAHNVVMTAGAIVLRAAGAFYLYQLSGVWSLEWVDNAQNTATLYAEFSNFNGVGAIQDFTVADIGGNWATAYGLATSRIAVTIADDTTTMTADGLIEHTITAATGITQELIVRRTDDSNCWIVRMDQTGSTCALIEKNAGVETSRSSVAQTWTNGTGYRIVAYCVGNAIDVYVASVIKATYTSATFNNTATGVKVSRAGTDLVAWPRVPTTPF